MSLLDRQGFFYTLFVLAGLALYYLLRRSQSDLYRALLLLSATFCSVCAMIAYNLYLGPWIIQSINGYRPDFSY